MPKDGEDALAILVGSAGVMVIAAVVIGGMAFVDAYVITHLWSWFIVTRFNAEPITYGHALGLAALLRYVVPKAPPRPKDDGEKEWHEKAVAALAPLGSAAMTLAFGYVVFRLGVCP
jgi:hypothetical protein